MRFINFLEKVCQTQFLLFENQISIDSFTEVDVFFVFNIQMTFLSSALVQVLRTDSKQTFKVQFLERFLGCNNQIRSINHPERSPPDWFPPPWSLEIPFLSSHVSSSNTPGMGSFVWREDKDRFDHSRTLYTILWQGPKYIVRESPCLD